MLRHRRGFTLIETVFAIFIFAVGALGLAATTAVVIRSLAQAAVRERAVRIASNRLETLRALSCAGARNGTESVQGIRASWTLSPGGSLMSATTTVTYTIEGLPRTESYSVVFPCPP